MAKKDIKALLEKLHSGELTAEEEKIARYWLFKLNQEEPTNISADKLETISDEMWASIEGLTHERDKPVRLWPRIAAAASILFVLGIGGYLALRHTEQPKPAVALLKPGTFKNDAVPGNKAYLTLSSGKQITVSNLPAGQIQMTNAANVQKTVAGTIIYAAGANANAPLEYNTFTVPRGGGKHEIKLADGTLAILDAESSIRFPVAFNGKERRVTVTGQVYFEVVHKSDQKFYVTVGNETIEDIGTHFNVNAFDGEIKTTLIEGSIKVNNILLQPGQQLAGTKVIDQVDEEEVLAWKNGLFKFGNDASLQTVMNQLSRWYDLDVVYQGPQRQHQFGGIISRDLKLSSVCKILSISGVQFSLDGKKITVYQ